MVSAIETEKADVKPVAAPDLSARLESVLHPPEAGDSFFSNLKDFLTARAVKLPPGADSLKFATPKFGSSLAENFIEWFRPLPPAARRAHGSEMLVDWQPWHRTVWNNIRDAIAPRKLPPLNVTSKPVAVKDIWARNKQLSRVQVASFVAHTALAALIIVPLLHHAIAPPKSTQVIDVIPLDYSPYLTKLPPGNKKAGGGGGGGEHNPLPASRGKLPKFSWTQFTPPSVKPPEHPRLQMTPTVLGPPELRLPSPNLPNYGDPLAKLINNSSGPGAGAGIGSGCCGGVGSGNGGGVGPGEGWGTGGGPPSAGTNGYGEPTCLYCPQPQYSDEAVKAKYQGVVTLQIVVTPDGRATNIRVVKGLGVGLDEKAIEAVRTWKFNPAAGPNGKPAPVTALIEVTFRLL